MNSRERVLCALNHQQPDRVPIDCGGTRQSGIAASTYHQLKQRLGLSTPTRVYDVYQMLAEIERPVMERFGADCVGLNRPAVAFGIRNEGWKPWRMFDGTPVEVPGGFNPVADDHGDLLLLAADGRPMARMPEGGFYFDRLDKYPGAAHADPADAPHAASLAGGMRPLARPGRGLLPRTPTWRSSPRWARPTSCSSAWARATSRPG